MSVVVKGSSGQQRSLSDDWDGRVMQRRVSRSNGLVLSDGGNVVRETRLHPVVARESVSRDGRRPRSRNQGRGLCVQRGCSIVQVAG